MQNVKKDDRVLIDELRKTVSGIMEKSFDNAAVDGVWRSYSDRLCQRLLTDDPADFLSWDMISRTMVVGNADFVRDELDFLKSLPDWKTRWENAIKESSVGKPIFYDGLPFSSGNLIHQAYHLAQFEKRMGMKVNEVGFIFEFGGGYGSLCRLLHNLNFKGQYVIFDLPPLSALQRFFLSMNNIPAVSAQAYFEQASKGVICVSEFEELKTLLAGAREAMFIATWSLSESPVSLRQSILPLVKPFKAFLIAYQGLFGDVDNVGFFNAWAETVENAQWQSWKITHIPNHRYKDNYYLMGKKDRETTAMRSNRDSLIKAALNLLPADNAALYSFCSQYVGRHNGEGNGNIETNGELRLMRQELPKSNIVFDIGANVGQWAKLSLKINPHLKVHCFEPSKITFQSLLSNQFPSNVVCNNFGFSSTRTEACLHVFRDGSALNSLYRRRGLEGYGISSQQQKETIRLETVDAYCKEHGLEKDGVDFCKIDVEGHELEVFKGMTGMLEKKAIRLIQFEYGGCNIDSRVLLKDIFDFFQPFDYTFYKIFPKRVLQVSRYDQRFENFQYQNWMILVNGDARHE